MPADAPIVIVSGLPRSGTSMMMQMIAAGGLPPLTDGKRAADADNPRGYFEFEAVKRTRQDASWLDQAAGRVVKMVHLLLLDLPVGHHYQVVMMTRELNQVLASQDVMLQRQGKQGANLSPEALARVYHQQMQRVETSLAQRADVDTLKIHYGDVIAEPRNQAEQVNAFLGGHLDVPAMADAVDPSLRHHQD